MSKERNGEDGPHDAPGQAPQQPDQPLEPRRALELADRIKPLLKGEHPAIMGAALVEIISTWLIGHAPPIRDEVFKRWISSVREMITINHHIMFGDRDPWTKDRGNDGTQISPHDNRRRRRPKA